MKTFPYLTIMALLGGLLTLSAADRGTRDADTVRWTEETERLVEDSRKISDMDGRTVRNQEGNRLGSIDDLVVTLPDGEITYAVVSSGGLFGIGAKDKLVPYDMLTYLEEEDEYRLDISKDIWDEVPTFDRRELADLQTTDRALDDAREWFRDVRDDLTRDDDRPERQLRQAGQGRQDRQDRMDRQGRTERTDRQAPEARRDRDDFDAGKGKNFLATEVLGYDVVDVDGEKVGNVSDFIIGRDEEKITHAVLSIGGFMEVGDEKIAIPPEELEIDNANEQVRLSVPQRAFTDQRTDEDEGWFDGIFNR